MSDWIAAAIAKPGLSRQEARDDERQAECEPDLPPARARHEQQELGDDDADEHPEHGLEHAARAGVAHEAEAADGDGGREERRGMPEHVVRERVGRGGGDDDLQDRDRGRPARGRRPVEGRSACATPWGWPA